MSQQSLFEEDTRSLETLPPSGMTRHGSLSVLAIAGPLTAGVAGGAWPTGAMSGLPGLPSYTRNPGKMAELAAGIDKGGPWITPLASDGNGGAPFARQGYISDQAALWDFRERVAAGQDVLLWPTPTASDGKMGDQAPEVWKAREIRKAEEGINQFPLSVAAQMAREQDGWAIDRGRKADGTPLLPSETRRARRGQATSTDGPPSSKSIPKLNPLFVSMLMGYGPSDVTLLQPSATAWMLSRRGSRSAASSRDASAPSGEESVPMPESFDDEGDSQEQESKDGE